MSKLDELRADLDRTDGEIVSALGRRFALCRRIAEVKREGGIPMMQPARVEHVKRRCAELGALHQVDPHFLVQLYTFIIDEACRMEDGIIEQQTA